MLPLIVGVAWMEGGAFQSWARVCALLVTLEIPVKCYHASPQNVLMVVPANQTPLHQMDIYVIAGLDIVETTVNNSLCVKLLSLAPTVAHVLILRWALFVVVLISGRAKTVPLQHVIIAGAARSLGHVLWVLLGLSLASTTMFKFF